MAMFVDLQGFKIPNNQFVVKELGAIREDITDVAGVKMLTVVFQAPCAWDALPIHYQKTNEWTKQYIHGMPWESGDFPYDERDITCKCIFRNISYIFVKGVEKRRWLNQLLDFTIPIIDLEDLGCPALRTLTASRSSICYKYHKNAKTYNCAFHNASKLRKWYLQQYGYEPSTDKSISLFYELGGLTKMLHKDIAELPKEFLIRYAKNNIDREDVWCKLPPEIQKDKDIATLKYCQKHYLDYNKDFGDVDEWDGPAPLKKYCPQCTE